MAGRLGNQMFRYAFARKIQILTGRELIIDFNRVYKNHSAADGWTNSLNLFDNIGDYKEVNGQKKKYFYKNATLMQLLLYFSYRIISKLYKKNKIAKRKFQLKMQPLMNKHNLYYIEQGYYDYDFSHLNKTKVIYICGCFECSKHFDDIREDILNKFSISEVSNKNSELISNIDSNNSVCISIRRGNFVTDKNNQKIYDICDVEYFNKAIKIMIQKLKNPTFFIFSDDVEWAKENLDFCGFPVFSEDGKDSLTEKLKLMSTCKHFIISNSTFSWWAQYLSQNNNKIVISPSKWYKINMPSDLIEENWIKIDVDHNRLK